MKCTNTVWIAVLFLSTSSFVLPDQPGDNGLIKKWVVSKNSSLSVNGSTNINKFSCVIPAYNQIDTLTLRKNRNDTDVLLSGTIALSISSFDCHNSGMTKQLRKTLNEKQFPLLHIRFLSLNKIPVLTTKAEPITGFVEIEIAGISKRVEVQYQITQDDQRNIHLLGFHKINFSDFNLEPPQKLGGMIKTKDQLGVDFQLNMKAMD